MLILFCWAYAIVWSIFPFVGWGKYIPEGILDSCSFDYLTRDDRVNNKTNSISYHIKTKKLMKPTFSVKLYAFRHAQPIL